jgi:hypothetical protein
MYMAIIVGCAAAPIIAAWRAAGWGRAATLGGLTCAVCGAALPPLLLGILLGDDWKDPLWCLLTMSVIGGVMAVIAVSIAAPCGAVLGVAGHATWRSYSNSDDCGEPTADECRCQ